MGKGKPIKIYSAMLKDEKWANLPTTAKLLYVYIKAEQTIGENGELKWAKLNENIIENCVRFDYGTIKSKYYGKRDYWKDRFNCDLTALANGGFIEFVEAENKSGETSYIVLLSDKWHTNEATITEPYIDGITASKWREGETNQLLLKLAKKCQHYKCSCGEPLDDNFHALRQANTTFGNTRVMYELLCPKCYEKRKVNGRIRFMQEL